MNWLSKFRRLVSIYGYFDLPASYLFCSIQSTFQVVLALGDYMEAQCHACIGGTNVREDLRKLGGGVHVVVGTPGRVFDMINRRALSMLILNISLDLETHFLYFYRDE